MKTWDERIDEVWDDATGEEVGDDTIARIDALAAERGPDDARAEFERAGARDSAGRPAEAVELYRRALAQATGAGRWGRADRTAQSGGARRCYLAGSGGSGSDQPSDRQRRSTSKSTMPNAMATFTEFL